MTKHEIKQPHEANCERGNSSWERRLVETGEPMEKKRIEGRRGGRAGTTQRSPLVQAAEVNASVVSGSIVFLPGKEKRGHSVIL